ncbi:transcobalamin-2 isoform X1 [Apteryx rowi]|uniref:transcobalamin-2 isoform X1 n=1 Tax=Apteryx rowi TaxID=308060 RepID=UPI000E1E173D|nr:transcobalamin-2 isoform X1 [Apteryx rowi]
MWWLLVLLQAVVLPAQLCEVPEEVAAQACTMSARLLGLAEDPAWEANPSIYVALRLADDHDLAFEAQYLARLKDAFQGPHSTSPQAAGQPKRPLPQPHAAPHGRAPGAHGHHRSAVAAGKRGRPNTGRLALQLLALRAACQPLDAGAEGHLVTRLKYSLETDWTGSQRHGHPLTNYYQYSLGILALCVQRKQVREEVIRRLLAAEQQGRFSLGHGHAVDTEAMAGLAFACLDQAQLARGALALELQEAVRNVSRKLLQAQGHDGFFGNVFSTPLAMQLFIATNTCESELAYNRARAALLQSLDNFTNPMAISQLLPALYGRSYLDIASMHCQGERDTLQPIRPVTQPPGPGNITVRLVVECPKRLCHHHVPYNQSVSVPTGSSLLDVLEAASKQGRHAFMFKTQDSLYGPFLTTVMKVEAKWQERRYWQLLSAPDTRLQTGIADYKPHDGETLILRLSKW